MKRHDYLNMRLLVAAVLVMSSLTFTASGSEQPTAISI